MSKWNWIHAGLEIANYMQVRETQKQLEAMNSALEQAAIRQMLIEAMRNFLFNLAKELEIAKEHLQAAPLQVYIIVRYLQWQLNTSGIEPQIFPEIADKEYTFKVGRELLKVSRQAKSLLSRKDVLLGERAVQYLTEMALLQKMVQAVSAQENLQRTEKDWKKMLKMRSRKGTFIFIGGVGAFITLNLFFFTIEQISQMRDIADFITVILILAPITLSSFILTAKMVQNVLRIKNPTNYEKLKQQRQHWQSQLLSPDDYQRVLETFGQLPNEEYYHLYKARTAYLERILGQNYRRYTEQEDQPAVLAQLAQKI